MWKLEKRGKLKKYLAESLYNDVCELGLSIFLTFDITTRNGKIYVDNQTSGK